MIITHDLSKNFNGFIAVDGLDLKVSEGELLALLGPNGAGKTTTVRMLTSVLKPSRGWARISGQDVVEHAAQVRAAVGVLTEHHGLYSRMPAYDYLDFFGQIYQLGKTTRRERIYELTSQFGLQEDLKRRVGEYSKGMRQKLALARALLHDPPVLLLDEPTSAMDPESARLVRDEIQALRSAERAIVICTHNLAEAEELADKIAIIRRGKIIAQGSPQSLKSALLGPPEFELRLAGQLNGYQTIELPGAILIASGDNWIRYRVTEPTLTNPNILRTYLDLGMPVLSLHEVPRSLEQVYMKAILSNDDGETNHVS